jgi:hypothetical protein
LLWVFFPISILFFFFPVVALLGFPSSLPATFAAVAVVTVVNFTPAVAVVVTEAWADLSAPSTSTGFIVVVAIVTVVRGTNLKRPHEIGSKLGVQPLNLSLVRTLIVTVVVTFD